MRPQCAPKCAPNPYSGSFGGALIHRLVQFQTRALNRALNPLSTPGKSAPPIFLWHPRTNIRRFCMSARAKVVGALAAFESWASVEEIVAFVGLPEKTVRRALQQIDVRKEPRRDGGKRKVVYRI